VTAIEIRPVSGMEDLERWVALHNEIRPDNPSTAGWKALVRAVQTKRADLFAYLDGVAVGTAVLTANTNPQDTGRPYVHVGVLPDYRGRGVGDALLRAASDHAGRFGRTGLACDADADDEYSLTFLKRRGFVEHRRWEQFVLDLDSHDGPAPGPPEGAEIVSLARRPELLERMHRVATEVDPELGGPVGRQAESFLTWQVYALGDTILDLDLLAVVGGDVVGFGIAREYDETTAELRMAAVLPDWRGRGIETALIGAQVASAQRTRRGRVIAWVPADTPPGEVYRRLGFAQAGGSIELHGPLLT
jgi:GNAT superfamily N-acetyltransferase